MRPTLELPNCASGMLASPSMALGARESRGQKIAHQLRRLSSDHGVAVDFHGSLLRIRVQLEVLVDGYIVLGEVVLISGHGSSPRLFTQSRLMHPPVRRFGR